MEDADEKVRYILRSEVENAVMEIRNKNCTGNDDVTKVFRRAFTECLCDTAADYRL